MTSIPKAVLALPTSEEHYRARQSVHLHCVITKHSRAMEAFDTSVYSADADLEVELRRIEIDSNETEINEMPTPDVAEGLRRACALEGAAARMVLRLQAELTARASERAKLS